MKDGLPIDSFLGLKPVPLSQYSTVYARLGAVILSTVQYDSTIFVTAPYHPQHQRLGLQWDRWGDSRTFPLAVWPAYRRCSGLQSLQKAESKSAPLIAKCRYKDLLPLRKALGKWEKHRKTMGKRRFTIS